MPTLHMGKFCIPLLNKESIHRYQLIDTINTRIQCANLLIHAPAGYGKTTAILQWLLTTRRRAAWLSLDVYDTTASDFYSGLLNALCTCADASTRALILKEVDTPHFSDDPFYSTLDILSKTSPHFLPDVIVIDDFHLCNDAAVAMSLPILFQRLPQQTRLVIISRTPPPDELYDCAIKGILKEISLEDLQFSKQEISDFFDKHGIPMSGYHAERLQKQTLGWPAALSALTLACRDENATLFNDKITNSAYLIHYLKNHIHQIWDETTRSIFMKTAICDCITQGLGEAITERKDTWEILTSLCKKTGLIMKLDSNTYRYHALLKDFLLSELEANPHIDKPKLYINAALWYKENNHLLGGLDMAVKSGHLALVHDILRSKADYDRFTCSVEDFAETVNRDLLRKLPLDVIQNSYGLSLECFFTCFAVGLLDEAKKWMDVAKKSEARGLALNLDDSIISSLYHCIDPREDCWSILKLFEHINSDAMQTRSDKTMPAFTLTFNLPFFHKAQRDYSSISPDLPAYIAESKKQLLPVFGPVFELLLPLLEFGIAFEQNLLHKAKAGMLVAERNVTNSIPELRFSTLMLLCEIYWAEGNPTELKNTLNQIEEMIAQTNSFYLKANLNAYITNLSLYNGDLDAAKAWLHLSSDFEKLPLKFYKYFQHLTTARALMVVGALPKAINLLGHICDLSQDYCRYADWIEATTLLSICYCQMKAMESAALHLTSAIIKSQELALPMPILKEGADLIPILQKLLNQIKYGHIAETLDKSYVNMLYVDARRRLGHHGGLFSRTTQKPIKLSQKQALILGLLSQKMSYKEMSVVTGTKITTIRDHVGKLYEKLGVSNADDALLKAKALGLIDM